MSVRYLGSKSRVAERIVDIAGPPTRGRFVDAFCGSGAVAAAAADRGWAVTLNDFLPSALAMSVAAVVGVGNVGFSALGGYSGAISRLNDTGADAGFLHSQYSPASLAVCGIERKYFTEHNAARIDAMRGRISEWVCSGVISWIEEQLLLADLISAANRVANIAGTYGCFLRQWTRSALRPIELRPRELPNRESDIRARVGDVFGVQSTAADVVYFDPPYTKRQYGAYYHILETIHAGDEPEVKGVTGLRDWRHKSSVFCYKARALDALRDLVSKTDASFILLSYSDEAHIPQQQLLDALGDAGCTKLHELRRIGRYRPNRVAAMAGDTVGEYLIEIQPSVLEGSLERLVAVKGRCA